jgi:hypothetical protein
MENRKALFFSIILCFTQILGATYGQQVADPSFDAKVARPAYTKNGPKVLIDEAHNNFHTATGSYKPFADLIANDGYTVVPNREKFQKKILDGYNVLVIANALGAERQNMPEASRPAFTDEECDVVRDWVRAGGSLLLIADHAPFGAAAENLARRFGVEMSKGHTSDPVHHDRDTGNMSFLVFARENGLLADHPITRGRSDAERVNQVITFTGQSLKGPPGSVALLRLSDTAMDLTRPARDETGGRPGGTDRMPDGTPLPPGVRMSRGPRTGTSAAGRAQGLALEFGQGRVIILGEAGMLSAQVVRGPVAQLLGREELQMGMNRKRVDNRQLALNIVHWLSRLLD